MTTGKSHVKERPKMKAFRSPWKTDIESVDLTYRGRLIHIMQKTVVNTHVNGDTQSKTAKIINR